MTADTRGGKTIGVDSNGGQWACSERERHCKGAGNIPHSQEKRVISWTSPLHIVLPLALY